MSDDELLIRKPQAPEPTQPAPHPKEHKRATVALWISCIAAFFALLAAIGSIWQAIEVRRARLTTNPIQLSERALLHPVSGARSEASNAQSFYPENRLYLFSVRVRNFGKTTATNIRC